MAGKYDYIAYYKTHSVSFSANSIKNARRKHPKAKVVRWSKPK